LEGKLLWFLVLQQFDAIDVVGKRRFPVQALSLRGGVACAIFSAFTVRLRTCSQLQRTSVLNAQPSLEEDKKLSLQVLRSFTVPESVPNSILKSLLLPYGARLRKKPKKRETVKGYGTYDHSTYNHPIYVWDKDANRMVLKQPDSCVRPSWMTGNNSLLEADFFAWYGTMNPQSNWASCRVCKQITWAREAREAHERDKTKNCRHFLWEALKKLRKDKRCVVCGAKTKDFKHSVFLCSVDCLDIWKHEENNFQGRKALQEALRLVGWKDS
jgi:hypothetical protein